MLPLDFKEFRRKLQEYVQKNTDFKDVNYEGSGINQLLNILAYTGNYMGYYLEANDNEHYLQTAQTRNSLYAGAKRNGYVVKGRRSSKTELYVECEVDAIPASKYLVIPRTLSIDGKNIHTDVVRDFLFNHDVYLYDYEKLDNGKYRFFSKKTFTVFQGQRKTWRFATSHSKDNRYVIKDDSIDIDTIRVFVKNSISDTEIGEEYILSKNMVKDFGKDNKIFNIVTAENGWYEIFFGKDLLGHEPEVGKYIYCEYISTTGEDGDGCTIFRLPPFKLTPTSQSFGGSNGESADSIRYNAPYSFRRQNRLITEDDVKSLLLEEFRNIKSINVWGGEENTPKYYGKIMIAIKPNNSDALSQGFKSDIKKRILDKYGYIGADAVLIDPEYIDVDIEYSMVMKSNIGDTTITNITDSVKSYTKIYNDTKLNQFGNYLNETDIVADIRSKIPYIDSIYSVKYISKSLMVNTNQDTNYTINVSNPIVKGTVKSTFKDYVYTWTMTDNGMGKLFCTTKDKYGKDIVKEVGTVDYDTGLYQFNLPMTSGTNYPYEIEIKAQSMKPNVYSKHVNIVRIRNVEVLDVLSQ